MSIPMSVLFLKKKDEQANNQFELLKVAIQEEHPETANRKDVVALHSTERESEEKSPHLRICTFSGLFRMSFKFM